MEEPSREGHREVATLYPQSTLDERDFVVESLREKSPPARAALHFVARGDRREGGRRDHGFIAKLKGFDAHAKPQAHLIKKTAEGGLVSLVGFAYGGAFRALRAICAQTRHHDGVDVTRDEPELGVDNVYPGFPCQLLSLDALDVSGVIAG